jgi:hypothetical protein
MQAGHRHFVPKTLSKERVVGIGGFFARRSLGGLGAKVELSLMRSSEHEVARSYVLYREERTRERAKAKGLKIGEKASGTYKTIDMINYAVEVHQK